jgi:hypothetical protein
MSQKQEILSQIEIYNKDHKDDKSSSYEKNMMRCDYCCLTICGCNDMDFYLADILNIDKLKISNTFDRVYNNDYKVNNVNDS